MKQNGTKNQPVGLIASCSLCKHDYESLGHLNELKFGFGPRWGTMHFPFALLFSPHLPLCFITLYDCKLVIILLYETFKT